MNNLLADLLIYVIIYTVFYGYMKTYHMKFIKQSDKKINEFLEDMGRALR